LERKPFAAIHRYLGWWVRIHVKNQSSRVGQIIKTGDLTSVVQFEDGTETNAANSALLDSHWAELHPSELSVRDATMRS
jgi:hypothetical protein